MPPAGPNAPKAPSTLPQPAARKAAPASAKKPAPSAALLPQVTNVETHGKLVRFVLLEAVIIAILAGILVFVLPLWQPINLYYARNPQQQRMPLVGLTMPNMTNRAVLSWATTSVTEIMTLGFGDYEQKLKAQRPRFTQNGWDAFIGAFIRQKIGEKFKQNQLVVTTVPSDTPVIVAQGVNPKNVYQWRVQMPVIMTYATNDNKNQPEKAVINLDIIRVSQEQNPASIGIDGWSIK